MRRRHCRHERVRRFPCRQVCCARRGHPNCRCLAERVDETLDAAEIQQQADAETPDFEQAVLRPARIDMLQGKDQRRRLVAGSVLDVGASQTGDGRLATAIHHRGEANGKRLIPCQGVSLHHPGAFSLRPGDRGKYGIIGNVESATYG